MPDLDDQNSPNCFIDPDDDQPTPVSGELAGIPRRWFLCPVRAALLISMAVFVTALMPEPSLAGGGWTAPSGYCSYDSEPPITGWFCATAGAGCDAWADSYQWHSSHSGELLGTYWADGGAPTLFFASQNLVLLLKRLSSAKAAAKLAPRPANASRRVTRQGSRAAACKGTPTGAAIRSALPAATSTRR